MTWKEIRKAFFPAMRRPTPTGIVRNGTLKRTYQCAICGAAISMGARWPMPKRVSSWIDYHDVACMALVHAAGYLVAGLIAPSVALMFASPSWLVADDARQEITS